MSSKPLIGSRDEIIAREAGSPPTGAVAASNGLYPGQIRLRGVSRKFRIFHERNTTLKETVLRRRRTHHTELWALRDVDLDINPGEALGIIGQNGAGKSTLLKLIAGILPAQTGTIEVAGSVASMLELGAGFHPDFSGRENVYMNGAVLGLSEREIDDRLEEIIAFAELPEFIDMPVKTYSSGMHMRLAFSVASHVNPDILLLDEVLAVGDEAFQRKCMGRIFDFRRRGGTLVFVSHDPGAIERICDRVILLEDGVVIADAAPDIALPIYHKRLAGSPHLAPAPHEDAGTAPDPTLADNDPRIWGTREVVIRDVRLLGSDGETDRFLSGEAFAVELDVDSRNPVQAPTLGLLIVTPDGINCYGTNTRLDAWRVPDLTAPLTVRFTIPRLHLHEGRFAVTLAATSFDDSIIYHWLDRWKEFSVFQRSVGIGLVDLAGKWGVVNRDSPGTSRVGD